MKTFTKKLMAVCLAGAMAFAACACSDTSSDEATEDTTAQEAASGADTEKGEGVMTYAEYAVADLDTEVTVETYIQAAQSWWENQATFYTQDADGAYFLYNMPCTEEEYAQLTAGGVKVKVTGYKSEWEGEVEITDATFEIEEGTYIADPVDVTEKLADSSLIDYQNMKVSFTGMTVEAIGDNGEAFLYNWDGSGTQGDDLYFNVSYNGNTYNFTVESYLTGSDTEVYKTVEGLSVGDTVDMEGFLYWYQGVNPHITSVTVK